MKAIMVMFDSLNRRMLQPYGCDWVHTPNFERLAERTVTFDNSYVGSMPCMPARREIHTGRYNFLHRSWGPMEPFDDSMPQLLRENGTHSHLITDHYHYFEDGGCTYHPRYQTWEISRGQEGEGWKADLRGCISAPDILGRSDGAWSKDKIPSIYRQDWVNRFYMQREEDMPQPKTFAMGEEFLRTNHAEDNWFLHLETFDPHEPYFSSQRFKDLYPHAYDGPNFDWPPYRRVTETPEQVRHCRYESAALHSMCDWYMGRVLDLMDELDLWKDTMLIVNTDHGFLLGEHDWWAKCAQPFYNEVAHTPLFIWDPRCGKRGERRQSLVQTIDLPATVLEYFGRPLPADMQGKPLRDTVANDAPIREAGLYGMHGGHVNCTDGRYTYMRAPVNPANAPLYNYTLMPTHMRGMFSPDELHVAALAEPFAFTKGCKTVRTDAGSWVNAHDFGTMLFDLREDPGQERPLQDPDVEAMMIDHTVRLMTENDAPVEQYERLGLPVPAKVQQ